MSRLSQIRRVSLTAMLLLVAGCATQGTDKPAVCDGHHRRPANPYGSVLPTVPLEPATSMVAPATPKTAPTSSSKPASSKPTAAKSPGPLSSIDPISTQPCGRAA